MDTLQGKLLIAGGGLFDPNFRQTVVLVAEHTDQGALGIVLNRRASVQVQDAVPALAALVAAGDDLYHGGPVERQTPVVLAEFEHPDFAGKVIVGSVGLPPPEPAEGIHRGVVRARVYAGYAGWGPGQLEAELGASSWIIEPASADDVFTDRPEALWASVLRRKGRAFRILAQMPFDPSSN